MSAVVNIGLGQRFDIGAWVDGKEVAVTWTGCNSIEGNRCYITMDSDKNVTAKFAKVPRRLR